MKLTTGIVLQERTFEGKTYKVSPCKIEGYVDDQEALKQAIYKVLDTDQYELPHIQFQLWYCMERADRRGAALCTGRNEENDTGSTVA